MAIKRRLGIALLVLLAWVILLGPVAVAVFAGGEVAADVAPVPEGIQRELFNDGTLGENLIAAGEWVQANDPCAVYAADIDPGQSNQVELFYLQECFGEAAQGE